MLGRGHHLRVHGGLGVGLLEAFLHDADLHALHAAFQHRGVGVRLDVVLARVVAVGTGDDLEQQRVVGDARRHRAGVVDIDLDRHDAGVGHQPVRRLHAVDAGERRRHADRAALVAADRHVDLAQRHQHRAARRRAAGRVAHLVRIVHRAGRAGVAAAGHAEELAMRLADDGGAGIEHALHDRGVDVGDVAFQRGRAVHHRHAGQHDVVLEHHGLALELAARRARDGRLDVPGVVLVLGRRRPVARRARILHRRQVVRHRVDHVVGRHARLHQVDERLQVCLAHRQADVLGDFAHLLGCRNLNGHGFPLC